MLSLLGLVVFFPLIGFFILAPLGSYMSRRMVVAIGVG
jgi:hypothetical protein